MFKSKSSCFPEMNLTASMESLSIPRQFSSRYTLRKAVQCVRSCTILCNLQKIVRQMQEQKQSEVWFWSLEFGFRPRLWPKIFHFCYVTHSTMWLSHFGKLHGFGKNSWGPCAVESQADIQFWPSLEGADRVTRVPPSFKFCGKWMLNGSLYRDLRALTATQLPAWGYKDHNLDDVAAKPKVWLNASLARLLGACDHLTPA